MTGARTLLFFATEDWFVVSHFMPLIHRAVADGWRVCVAARMTKSTAALQAARVKLINFASERGARSPMALANDVSELRAIIARERPALIHAIALKPIVIAALAGGKTPAVYALTGLGYLGANERRRHIVTRALLLRLIERRVRQGAALLVTENVDDARAVLGKTPGSPYVVLPGAGVDPTAFLPVAEPSAPPVRIGLVARLVKSKGVDLAVDAVRTLRASGALVELVVAGSTDPDNPGAYAEAALESWRAAGVQLRGHVTNISAFWADTHIACLPSRGGEGLPRALIEAAACGRPIVTTDVPGCRDFVLDSQTGFVAPRNDVHLLAAALGRLCDNPGLRAEMGAAGRARVEAFYTTECVADGAAEAWERALQLGNIRRRSGQRAT